MKSEKLKKYLDDIIKRGVKVDYWFMTKQTVDLYLELFIAQVVERYQLSEKTQGFAKFYSEQFENNDEMAKKYPTQLGENTYRNAIIPEYLGLIQRSGTGYDTATVTDAYNLISKYINTCEDMKIYHELIERQLEKLPFNVLNVNHKNEKYSDISIFAVMLLYKILYELCFKTGNSKLSYNEFVIFVMRTRKYADWENCLNLILLSREEDNFDSSKYIDEIVNQQYVHDIRFDTLFNELSNIKYNKKKSFEIIDDNAKEYIKNVLEEFESSKYCELTDKGEIKEFLCSANYFAGPLDNDLTINNNLYIDKLEEGIVEELTEKNIQKKNKSTDIQNTTSIKIIEFPDTFEKNKENDNTPAGKTYNFEKINKRNCAKGIKAEELVLEYEKTRLLKLGVEKNIPEHVSKTQGDGLGYDILSYDIIDGDILPIYIEVKGSILNENAPFDISRNELKVAKKYGKRYRIYRVTSLGANIAKCFVLDGEQLFEKMIFEPISFKVFKKGD